MEAEARLIEPIDATPRCLRDTVRESLDTYFKTLDGYKTSGLYDLILEQVEQPLFEVVLQRTNGNISRAAELLGMNRGTLRNRLKKYDLL